MPLRVGPPPPSPAEDLAPLRDAIRREHKLQVRYQDERGRVTERVLWPFAIGYFTGGRVLVAWCEQRASYRHFRSDRLISVRTLDERYPQKRADMLREWRRSQV